MITPAPTLVRTAFPPRAVVQARRVRRRDACLRGGETLMTPGPTPALLALDFGEELVGVLELTVTAGAATRLELIYGEDLEEALLLQDPYPPEHWYHQPRDFLDLPAGAQVARQPGRRAFRFVTLVVHGPGALRLHGAVMLLEHAPLTDRGWFNSSDPLLNDAWQISRRTLRLCLQGFYEDGVKRDGMLWLGDYRVEFLCAHPLFADAALARRSLEMFAQCRHEDGSLSAVALLAGGHLHPRIGYLGDLSQPGFLHRWVLANYCADFVAGVWEYVLHTGDVELVRSLDTTVRGVLAYLHAFDLAKAESPKNFITDNQPEQPDWWGSRAALAYQIAAAFGHGAALASLLGDEASAARHRAEQARRGHAAADRFGSAATASCRDFEDAGATRSWHAHAAAYHAGALDAAGLRSIHPRLQADPTVRRPMAGFMEFYLLQAWFDAGLAREALAELRSYYGQMLRSGATTTWELVDRREPGIDHIVPAGRSHCHGWSAGPAYHCAAQILGVVPTAPGYHEVSIRPSLGDLAWAEGEVATPHGTIHVSLDGDGHGEATLPPGVTGVLHLAGRPAVRMAPEKSHAF
ncbi:MAG: hypothetical protein JSR48_01955 [Verrucomicrobia bacterium]|nr:hypothetical protein [Verrucomicrobiota bacterium]